MSKDLIGKYCLREMTPSKTEFHSEKSVITSIHKTFPDSYVHLDGDCDSAYFVNSLLITDDIEILESLLEVQKDYLEKLNALRNRIHTLKKDHSVTVSKMIKEIK